MRSVLVFMLSASSVMGQTPTGGKVSTLTIPVPAVQPPAVQPAPVTPPPITPPAVTPPAIVLNVVADDGITYTLDGNTLTIHYICPPDPNAPTITGVSVAGPSTLQSGASAQYTATVQGTNNPSQAVTWNATVGSITATGMYTAPATAGSATVAATASDNTTKGGMAVTVTATPPPTSESPNGTELRPADTGKAITDAGNHKWTYGTTTDSRGTTVLIDSKPSSSAAVLLVYENHGVYSQTASGSWWGPLDLTGNGPKTTDPRPKPPNGGGGGTTVLLAFPGAMGGGALTKGGRGGVVIPVTNLNDSGPGSFRAAAVDGRPRTVTFNRLPKPGIIPIMSQILVGSPFITVAGQTGPGQIILGGRQATAALRFSTHDVIITYVTISGDNPSIASGPDTGTVCFYVANTQASNFFTGHLSLRWAGNKMWIMYAGFDGQFNKDTTMQDCLVYEPHCGHPVGPSTSENDNAAITAASGNIDCIRDFFVNIDHRIMEYNHSPMRYVNNVYHNVSWYEILALGATKTDVINNLFTAANMRPSAKYPIFSTDGNYPGSNPGTPSFYVDGNIGLDHNTPNTDQWGELCRWAAGENINGDRGPMPVAWKRTSPMPVTNGAPITLLSASGLAQTLSAKVGNSQHLDKDGNWINHRDAADTRIVNQVLAKSSGGFWPNGITQTGSSIPNPLPTPTADYTTQTPQAFTPYVDSQGDGLSDAWKQAMQLDTSKAQNNFIMPDGYTALEWFLAGRKS